MCEGIEMMVVRKANAGRLKLANTGGVSAILTALESHESMTHINLDYNGLFADATHQISSVLKKNSRIAKLSVSTNDLSGYDISNQGRHDHAAICKLADALEGSGVTDLDLSNNWLTSRDAKALAQMLKVNQRLTALDLRGNRIMGSRAAATHLAAALEQTTLQSLSVSNCSLDEVGRALLISTATRRGVQLELESVSEAALQLHAHGTQTPEVSNCTFCVLM